MGFKNSQGGKGCLFVATIEAKSQTVPFIRDTKCNKLPILKWLRVQTTWKSFLYSATNMIGGCTILAQFFSPQRARPALLLGRVKHSPLFSSPFHWKMHGKKNWNKIKQCITCTPPIWLCCCSHWKQLGGQAIEGSGGSREKQVLLLHTEHS